MKFLKILLITLVGLMLLGAMACSDDDSGNNGSDGDSDGDIDTDHEWGLGTPCPLEEKVGEFKISHYEIYSALTGNVTNGVVPITVLFPKESFGECQLLQKINPTCDPPCESTQACAHGEECVPGDCPGECIPYPETQNAGTLTITGLTSPLSIEPNIVNDYSTTEIDHPPFAAGSQITLYSQGGDVEAFALDGLGVTPLSTPDGDWIIDRDETTLEVIADLEITWTPSDDGAEILATLNVDQHGNSPATMFCTFEDDGSATIPMDALDKFTEYGVTGYAAGYLYRRTVDSQNISLGCVEMQTFSVIKADLVVTNHDPDDWPPSK